MEGGGWKGSGMGGKKIDLILVCVLFRMAWWWSSVGNYFHFYFLLIDYPFSFFLLLRLSHRINLFNL